MHGREVYISLSFSFIHLLVRFSIDATTQRNLLFPRASAFVQRCQAAVKQFLNELPLAKMNSTKLQNLLLRELHSAVRGFSELPLLLEAIESNRKHDATRF
jgi:uncharacterized membrane protein